MNKAKRLFISMLTLLCCCTGAWAEGELNGVFSVSSTKKVLFSKGNLQYVDENYQFAEHQYDYFGGNQYSNHVDMFANNGYSSPDGDTAWRILSQSEWSYLYTERSVTNTLSEGARYSKATIGGTYKGVIVFPDSYTHPNGTGFAGNCNNAAENYASTVSLEGWALMEAAGCVFLPAAGYNRDGNIKKVNDACVYDSSTANSSESRCTPGFYYDNIYLGDWSYNTTCVPVRLVKDAMQYTVPASGIGTFSAKAKFTVPDGLTAHYCKTYNSANGTIGVVNIDDAVPANTGVLLKGTAGETYTLTGTNSEAATVTDNALVAVTEETFITQKVDIDAVNYTNFGLSGGVFKKVNSSGGTVKANRAYLQIPTSELPPAAEAQGIMLVWDEETDGIEIVQTSTVKSRHDDAWFTLDGRQLSGKPTAKGLYIVNGKKVIIK